MNATAWGGAKHAWSVGTIGKWGENKVGGQHKKEHRGQNSSTAVLDRRRRRCYRIKLVRDGAGGNQGTQPGLLVGKKKKGLLSDVVIPTHCSGFTHTTSKGKGPLTGPCAACICGTGKM